jgi:hypothetical protein
MPTAKQFADDSGQLAAAIFQGATPHPVNACINKGNAEIRA